MSVHESTVNYENLIRDLAEMYPCEVAEVVIIELVANALDAGANSVEVNYDPARKVINVADNGKGMNAAQFHEYHDFAAGLKTRGTGIGFAGVGAKISFNIAHQVVTETRSREFEAGSNWHLESRRRLVWEDLGDIQRSGCGTSVSVHLRQNVTPWFSSGDDLAGLIRRHYLPLLDPTFLELYERLGFYDHSLRFVVNGCRLEPVPVTEQFGLERSGDFVPMSGSKRIGFGILGIASSDYPIAPDVCGVLVCTHGKVIKADLFSQFPGSLGPRLFGLVEVPELIGFLTTSKTDFFRKGKRRGFERLYDPIRQEFKAWLKAIGVSTLDVIESDEASKLQKEIKRLLAELPELAEFFGLPATTPVLNVNPDGPVLADAQDGSQQTYPADQAGSKGSNGPTDAGDGPESSLAENPVGATQAGQLSRVSRKGLQIGFVEAPERIDLAWIEGNRAYINQGHPAYSKAEANPSARRLHSMFALATAIQRALAAGLDTPDLAFIDRMLSAWGKK